MMLKDILLLTSLYLSLVIAIGSLWHFIQGEIEYKKGNRK